MNAYQARELANGYYVKCVMDKIEAKAEMGLYKVAIKLSGFEQLSPEIVVATLLSDGFKLKLFIKDDFAYSEILDDWNSEKFGEEFIHTEKDYESAVDRLEQYAEEHDADCIKKYAMIEISW